MRGLNIRSSGLAKHPPHPKARRQKGRGWRFAPSRRTLLAGALALSTLGAAIALWQTGTASRLATAASAGIVRASIAAGFTVESIHAEGRRETTRESLLAALGAERGTPLLMVDPDAARNRLEALSWVHSARVERQWPDTLRITIVERRPMARWQADGRLLLVGNDSAIIGPADDERFAGLPLIVGAGAPQAAPELFDVLATRPDLFARIAACERIGERRWNLQFDDGIAVLLPEERMDEAWTRLAELVTQRDLLDKAIMAIDLRLGDRLVLRLTPEAAGLSTDSENRI